MEFIPFVACLYFYREMHSEQVGLLSLYNGWHGNGACSQVRVNQRDAGQAIFSAHMATSQYGHLPTQSYPELNNWVY